MKTVKDLCKLQENALSINVSDQIEQLDQLIQDEGDGQSFFAKTYITEGMGSLLTEGIARLAGKSSQALFHLKQAMGGGKTHLMVGFGLLARNPDLRRNQIPHISHFGEFGSAKVAAFNGRNTPTEFFWGSIASQLGKPELFQKFWSSGPRAPDERDWIELFNGPDPILILMDEIPPYFEILNATPSGNGTLADIATRALANLFSAAGKKSNVCVVVSDLTVAYGHGAKGINTALENARQELGRGEKTITPVDLAGNEIYEILRKRLFKSMPNTAAIDEISASYAKAISEATKAKIIGRAAESIADEISATYPFHPRLKNLIALFKENEQFRQTRGLMELVSRLLKSVWDRSENDVYLVGPQHFDLSITAVRDKLVEISKMGDVIAKDLWDANGSAHVQITDSENQNECARYAANVILTSSLSTAHNAIRGLTSEEILECTLSPFQDATGITSALDQLNLKAWYLHHAQDGKYYFDRQENLTKLLQDLAEKAPQPQVDEVIKKKLEELFKPARKVAYEELLALPSLDAIEESVKRKRVLAILPPDGIVPSFSLNKFFQSVQSKNNLLVLTGEKSVMDSLEQKARFLFASLKAEPRIPKGHAQREELERKQEQFASDLTGSILMTFDKVLFPLQRLGKDPQMADKPLLQNYNQNKPFSGEAQIEATLAMDPKKLYLDVQADFDAIRYQTEELLWPQGNDDARWSDVKERYSCEPGMVWLPLSPNGLDQTKTLALNKNLWEDLGNGYVTKKPRPKKATLQIIVESESNDQGEVRLRLSPQNAGPKPRIHYQEEGPVSSNSPVIQDSTFTTKALWVEFLVVDPTGSTLLGDEKKWENNLKIRHRLDQSSKPRKVELTISPRGELWYSLDGSEPRNGTPYQGPIEVGDAGGLLQVYGHASTLEKKDTFHIPSLAKDEVSFHQDRPASLLRSTQFKLDSRLKTFELLELAKEAEVEFSGLQLNVGQNQTSISVSIPQKPVKAEYLWKILMAITDDLDPLEPITMGFRKAQFRTGKELKEFADKAGFTLGSGDIQQ